MNDTAESKPEDLNSSVAEELRTPLHGKAYVFRHEGYQIVDSHTPFVALVEKEESTRRATGCLEESHTRTEVFGEILRYVFADGPHPGHAVKRLYALARSFTPELIVALTPTQMATLFAEGSEARAERVNMIFDGYQSGHAGRKPPRRVKDNVS